MRSLLIAALVVTGISAASLSASAQGMTTSSTKMTAGKTAPVRCKDAKGKFMKCAAPAAPVKAKQCRDAKGKFIKC